MLPLNLNAFQGEEHQPFHWQGGGPAALLVHGFPGTPAEMRPLAKCLHAAGWTARGVLLPGFGPQIETLPERTPAEWIGAVRAALAELQRAHHPVLLIGHSLGGAISIQVAIQQPPDGLALTAPFWEIDNVLWRLLPVLKYVFPQIRPFRLFNLDFSDPDTRDGIRKFMPDADIDSQNVREAIRHLALPLRMFDQIRALGRLAYASAPYVTVPKLIIQGSRDDLVKPHMTRRLVDRLRAPLRYLELAAEHNVNEAAHEGWPQVETTLLDFAASLGAAHA